MAALYETGVPLLLMGLAIFLWLEARQAHEQACRYCQELCREAGVQLLDQTVALRRLAVIFRAGRLSLRRHYVFDISLDGTDRHRGSLSLMGNVLDAHTLPWRNKVIPDPLYHAIDGNRPQ